MKKPILFYSIFLLLLFNSCAYLFYGMTAKNYESHKQQLKFLNSRNIDTTNVYSIKSSYIDSLSFEKYALNTYKLKTGASYSAIQIRMYSNKGDFIYGWSPCMGNNPHSYKIFETLPISSPYQLPVNYKLNFFSDLDVFNIDKITKNKIIERTKESEYVIIVYWAEWTGGFAKRVFEDITNYLNKYPNNEILVLKLNTASYCD